MDWTKPRAYIITMDGRTQRDMQKLAEVRTEMKYRAHLMELMRKHDGK